MKRWTAKELEILKEVYPTGPDSVQKLLKRSLAAIYCKASLLKLKTNTWSEEDTAKLLELFPHNTVKEISFSLGRTWQSVRKKAKRLGLKHDISQKTKLHISEAKSGKPSPLKGKRLSYKTDLHPYIRTPEIRAKTSTTKRKAFENGQIVWNKDKHNIYSPETLKKLKLARQKQKIPRHNTKPEREFVEICQRYKLPFKYTGDGQIWIGGVNPDFVDCNGRKIAVDIFGDYWHTPLFRKTAVEFTYTEEGRKAALKEYGWKLVVIWQSELGLPDAEERILAKLRKVGIKT